MGNEQLDDNRRWQIALAKDRAFDGVFVTGVHSTGIYCRPSCPARAPKRENVRFYATCADAEAAGLRACKRCTPQSIAPDEQAVLRCLELLQSSEAVVPLEKLGNVTGYSPTHLQRVFKRSVGMSPAAYHRALRREKAGNALSDGASVTGAVYDAGYSTPSRFYDEIKDRLGMSASAWRDGGRDILIRYAITETTFGPMLVAATNKGVCRLSFSETRTELVRRFPNAELAEGGAEFEALLQDVIAAVEQPGDAQHIPLDVKGTAFQEAVWQQLRKIPAGETRSYAQIAAAAGNPKAMRAAGSANGANCVAVLIPCHRVVRSDGAIGGYAYGAEIKRELLKREEQCQSGATDLLAD
ncbi:bifunctional DNA-binding transcriptional regulator/O6-methylguanine-DNA methyltransferase Ada [Pontixanthobacter gangjinensis]|uniref:methylated-DNA--[protein]-cysteine S-methyltransferase n=1 Tax=Pontixanthobacter gangjinensis TaxID=1028742 RepID=A0A6I4SL87_9SPHN|nr:bifunctional DNA-binding transcriptional regulator/O6-methylguanine-DNA methyltransferase Ada [Pontixanthobacter gangjinensis]MXO56529.1 bifunctional DNA-binding transcriptional regulator/O6-methylguanine-DNA methyltransferase Ada [Pontixanthobacter gangjinensis]